MDDEFNLSELGLVNREELGAKEALLAGLDFLASSSLEIRS